MQMKKEANNKDKTPLPKLLAEFCQALNDEIRTIESSGQSSILLNNGYKVDGPHSNYWYRFTASFIPAIPADTPCDLIIGKDSYSVTVISFDETSIIISSRQPLPDVLVKAQLNSGTTKLMERLIDRIVSNADKENRAGKRMLPADKKSHFKQICCYTNLELPSYFTQAQCEAVQKAVSNDITYIWGPPGTGKTTVIGQIIKELYSRNRSVLIVSHTNTAVDGAIAKADNLLFSEIASDRIDLCPILRFGNAGINLPERTKLSTHVKALGKELFEQKQRIEDRQLAIQSKQKEAQNLLAKIDLVKRNRLSDIKLAQSIVLKAQKRIELLKKQEKELCAELESINNREQDYQNYIKLKSELSALEKEQFSVKKQITIRQEFEQGFFEKAAKIKEEIAKHRRYKELLLRKSKMQPESEIVNKIRCYTDSVKTAEQNLQNLKTELSKINKTLEDYRTKTIIGRLFIKTAYEQAQTRLPEIEEQIRSLNAVLIRNRQYLFSQQEQLEELHAIEPELNCISPSYTENHWNQQLDRLIATREEYRAVLFELKQKESCIEEKYNDLQSKALKAKAIVEKGDALEEDLKSVRYVLQENQKIAKQQSEDQQRLLAEDLARCEKFYSEYTDKTLEEIAVPEFEALLEKIAEEMKGVNPGQLELERDKLHLELEHIEEERKQIDEKISQLEKEAVERASIIGATLTSTYLSEMLQARNFDTVILDEASMASIPALWCASLLAEKNIVIVGDFLQLSPIVMADTEMAKEWLGKDIFYHSGMQEMAKNDKPDNFVMLNEQLRMESAIADIANMYYGEYGGLKSNDNTAYRQKARGKFYEWFPVQFGRKPIQLMDTQSLHAWVTGVPRGKGHSRLNCVSAAVDVALAFKFIEKRLSALDKRTAEPTKEPLVLIVAPYKPHTEQIKALLDSEYKNRGFTKNLNYIQAGTIHSFQGGEADIVIFDLVVDEPHWRASLFVNKQEENANLKKMFNVAITRARFKLYVVGNFSYCQKKAKNNALGELLRKLEQKENLPAIDAKKLLPDLEFAPKTGVAIAQSIGNQSILCREDSFADYLIADIKTFSKRLIFYSPFITENRLGELIPYFMDALSKGKEIVVVTKTLSERSAGEQYAYDKCEKELTAIGVRIIHKKGMHEKLIFVDSTAVWAGSLNALSFSGFTGEIMHRHGSPAVVKEYEKIFDIEHISEVLNFTQEQRCPICGGEMIAAESKEGGIYWSCENEDYTRNVNQQYPIDGVLRCSKCGSLYCFEMKKQPRWVCTQNPRHYQIVRQKDFKLPRMAAMLSKSERKAADHYFEQKQVTAENAHKNKSVKSKKSKEKQAENSSEQAYTQLSLF